MSYESTEQTVDYPATRLMITTNARFEAFVSAFAAAVPELTDADAVSRLATDGDWAAFARGLAWEAPHGFVTVWSSRPSDLMRFAGAATPSAMWLIVNHAVGARLYRHDPAAVLYSPLRIVAYAARGAGTMLCADLPSAQLRGFGVNKITQAGAELDRALGDLIEGLGVPRPTALRR